MIVVTTPTGRIGRQLVTQLLEEGSAVRVIVRDAAHLDENVRDRVEIVEGSHADAAVLDRALVGAEALFWLVPPNPSAPSAEEHYLDFARAGAAAIRRHGVGHVVAVTSAGHGWAKPAGLLSAAFEMDAELEASGAAYRAVSLPFYMENLVGQADAIVRTGALSLTCAADRPLAMIATRDIAAQAAGLLTDLSWTGQQNVPVFSADRLTPAEIARVIGDELGRSVEYRQVAMADFAAMLRSRGASEQAVRDTVEMFASQDEGIYDADWPRATLAPTDFRTWCREVLVPAVERSAAQVTR
ncbi:NAD(P)H-binding protein [Microbacterium sp. ARD32]|uniref:NmrA family NAD(P)-binding protein n=1 Tax=Microbacterium sp. ARD32 TaxID=2962577 RepID=UPI0028815DB1|nr:NAD(P)H-binding protein [Microbacterium sp. ARD32]MDT0158106.1 NAD(P)H-binding protein [Microbacterium sp. ARD32]